MRKLLYLTVLAGFFACSEKDAASDYDTSINFSYSLDTVMVDSGDEFIYLNWNLYTSDLSADEKYLYNFKTGGNPTGLEVINLENLKLEKVIPMSLDGPNSIRSPYISNVYLLPDGTFYLSDNYEMYYFDQEGNKLSSFNYEKQEFEGERLPETQRIKFNEVLSKDGKTLVALYGGQKMGDAVEGLATFDLGNKRVSYTPLDFFQELEKYQSILYYEGVHPMSMALANIFLELKNDTLLYSNSAQNTVFFYHLKTDSLSSKTFSSKYTTNEAPGNYQKRTDSEEEFREIMQAKDQEAFYGQLFFDAKNKVHWRFSKEMDQMKGDTIQYKTVLTAFDSNFNQLHEELLPSDFVLPDTYFAREGMIYTFLNIDDELAFVRIKPTITYE